MSDVTVPTTTHLCPVNAGKMMPGKGPHGRGADRCAACFNEYCKELRQRKRDARPAGVSQLKLNRGHDGTASTRHGFYRSKLDKEEARIAQALHAEFMAKYDLDSLADDMVLVNAVVNFVKSLRREPEWPASERGQKEKSIRDYQSYYERNFKEALQALGLTRKDRRDEGKKDDVKTAIEALFRKRAADSNEADA